MFQTTNQELFDGKTWNNPGVGLRLSHQVWDKGTTKTMKTSCADGEPDRCLPAMFADLRGLSESKMHPRKVFGKSMVPVVSELEKHHLKYVKRCQRDMLETNLTYQSC